MAERSHRIRLLGPLLVSNPEGEPFVDTGGRYEPTSPRNSRLLIALALRAGELLRSQSLIQATWADDYRESRALQTPVANLRHLVPIPKQGGMEDGYRLALERNEVDALDFIDSARDAREPAEINRLLDLWREDPMQIHKVHDSAIWLPLEDALTSFLRRLEGLDAAALSQLRLDAFYERLPHRKPRTRKRARVLIVDDHPGLVSELEGHLAGYECVVATSLSEAIRTVEQEGDTIDGAIVDLHLTADMESGGLAVLTTIRDNYPEMPRVLLTRTPMLGSGMREQIEKFGLFDLITKSGESTPYIIRTTVEQMIGTSIVARRRRLLALLNTHGGSLDHLASQAQRAAKKAHRRHPDDDLARQEFVRAAAQRSDLEEDLEELRAYLDSDELDIDQAEDRVSSLVSKWQAKLRETS